MSRSLTSLPPKYGENSWYPAASKKRATSIVGFLVARDDWSWIAPWNGSTWIVVTCLHGYIPHNKSSIVNTSQNILPQMFYTEYQQLNIPHSAHYSITYSTASHAHNFHGLQTKYAPEGSLTFIYFPILHYNCMICASKVRLLFAFL